MSQHQPDAPAPPREILLQLLGAEWFHEAKYDGYRLGVERDGDRVRLITRGGYEWSKRYPWIVEVALRNRHKQYVIDGKAVILGVDGVSDFNAFHSRKQDHEVQLCAFDVVALDSDDLRNCPYPCARRTGTAATWQTRRRDRSRCIPRRLRHGT